MSLGILAEDKGAALYDTVTMTAFGPVMPCALWAEAFVEWLGDADPRTMDPKAVSAKWDDFAPAREECGCGTAIVPKGGVCGGCTAVTCTFIPNPCPGCGDPYYVDGCPKCGYGINGYFPDRRCD